MSFIPPLQSAAFVSPLWSWWRQQPGKQTVRGVGWKTSERQSVQAPTIPGRKGEWADPLLPCPRALRTTGSRPGWERLPERTAAVAAEEAPGPRRAGRPLERQRWCRRRLRREATAGSVSGTGVLLGPTGAAALHLMLCAKTGHGLMFLLHHNHFL